MIKKMSGELSGGEQQRVAIVRAIVTHEENLIAHCDQIIRLKDGEIILE